MTREEEIVNAAMNCKDLGETKYHAFAKGAKWADSNPLNPWISVEDRLPEKGDMVFTRSIIKIEGGGVINEDEQFLVQKFVGYWISDRMGQTRMYGIMYDTINKVTHWIPIPELKKGGAR